MHQDAGRGPGPAAAALKSARSHPHCTTPEPLTCLQVEETSGWVCVGMRGSDLDRLQLPLLVPPPLNDEALRTAFAMPVDLAAGTTTGIDAHDRQVSALQSLHTGSSCRNDSAFRAVPLAPLEGSVPRRGRCARCCLAALPVGFSGLQERTGSSAPRIFTYCVIVPMEPAGRVDEPWT